MVARVLNWQKGAPCKGMVYYLHATYEGVKFHLARFVVDGEDRFILWKGEALVRVFDDRREALVYAENLV